MIKKKINVEEREALTTAIRGEFSKEGLPCNQLVLLKITPRKNPKTAEETCDYIAIVHLDDDPIQTVELKVNSKYTYENARRLVRMAKNLIDSQGLNAVLNPRDDTEVLLASAKLRTPGGLTAEKA